MLDQNAAARRQIVKETPPLRKLKHDHDSRVIGQCGGFEVPIILPPAFRSFKSKNHTGIINLLVSFRFRSSQRKCRTMKRTRNRDTSSRPAALKPGVPPLRHACHDDKQHAEL
jgi:hypothetical protein